MGTIQIKRGTKSALATNNPLLLEGQPCFEIDTGQLKIGNGADNWNDLPYIGGGNNSLDIDKIYPIGSLYFSATNADPNSLFTGTTWESYGQGKTIVGKAAEGTFSKLESTGGAESKSISVAGHTHTIAHTHTIGNHTHTLNGHTHGVGNHTHTLSSHTHTVNSHAHGIGATAINVNQMASHNHNVTDEGYRDQYGAYRTNAGAGGLWYCVTPGWMPNQGSSPLRASFNGGNGGHSHSCAASAPGTGGPSNNNTSSAGGGNTGGPSNNSTSSAGSTTTSAASVGSSGSAGAQTISVNVTQPYIVVNIWKRTA